MKEMLTKKFWQGVKKTYNDALNGETPAEEASPAEQESGAPVDAEARPSIPERDRQESDIRGKE